MNLPSDHRPLRLAMYTDSASWGGAEVCLSTLVTHLDAGVEITILGPHSDVIERVGADRELARIAVPGVRNKFDIAGMTKLRAAIAGASPDVLHVNLNTLWSGQYAILAASTIPRLPIVAVEHCAVVSTSVMSRRLKHFTSARLAAHVAVGERVRDQIEQLIGLRPSTMRTIHNGVGISEPIRGHRVTDALVIGTVARLDKAKGIDVLIRAVARLDDGHLVVIGDGEERHALEQLSRAEGLADRVHFLGWCEDPARFISGFDIFALPSRLEAFPLTILEAMAASLPVVATNVGSVSEAVLDGHTGVLVGVDDEDGLVAALGRLATDPIKRRTMGDAGRLEVQRKFSASVMASTYMQLYEEVRQPDPPGHRRHKVEVHP
ncbi:MAG: glycosyltransferase family 4 protein [Acidimicrobiales bacterium]